MTNARKVETGDCETDPFLHQRVPKPFLWGLYNGKVYRQFATTDEFVAAVIDRKIVLYAHSGGKFDWMFLLPYIGETRVQVINGRFVSMMLGQCELRDSFSIVPISMKEIEKQEIEMWKLEATVRHKFVEEIVERNRTDCIYLYNLVKNYREVAGKQKTIASNALAFSKKLGIDPGKTNARFDRDFRPFFFGGRTQCFKYGTYRNTSSIDIHSAYPFAMTHDHPTGNSDDFFRKDDLRGLTDEQIGRSFIIIECTARGCFPFRTKTGLEFPHEYNEFHVTGWEYLAARDLGLISDVKIQSVRYSNKTINFTDYVHHWYQYKDAHPKKTNPIEYTIGKIMMNSLPSPPDSPSLRGREGGAIWKACPKPRQLLRLQDRQSRYIYLLASDRKSFGRMHHLRRKDDRSRMETRKRIRQPRNPYPRKSMAFQISLWRRMGSQRTFQKRCNRRIHYRVHPRPFASRHA